MRVQIITNLFAPDELAGAALFTDLALYLKQQAHDVRVTCTFSYYPAWKLREEDCGCRMREECFHGIPIRRLGMYVPSYPSGRGRLRSDLSFFRALLLNARWSDWRPDVVLTAIPMLSQSLVQRFLYFGQGIPRLIVVQDFVAEAALELGILRLPGAAQACPIIQRWALRSARTLVTISPEMLDKLRVVVGSGRRTRFLPNWIHESLQRTVSEEMTSPPIRSEGLLLYAGNLGVKQGLSEFLKQFDAAAGAGLGWTIKMHGGGAEAEQLANTIRVLRGCELGPVLEERDYISALLSASACLVTQRGGTGANFLPSKLLPALATATPVLAVCEHNTPLAREVREGRFGEVVQPGDSSALASTLYRWKSQPELLREFSRNAKARAALYRRELVLPQYETELVALVHGCEPQRARSLLRMPRPFSHGARP